MLSRITRLWKRSRPAPQSRRPRLERLEERAVPALFAVGAGEGGGPRVRVFNEDLTPRFDFMAYDEAFRGGVRVGTADVTGDGQEDIITGPGPGGGPHVKVFDGVTGGLVREWMAYDPNFRGGIYVAGGDLTGTPGAEVVTGAGEGGGPHVRGFSLGGDAGSLPVDPVAGLPVYRDFFAYENDFRGGVRVGVGEVTGDQYVDIFTGPGVGGGADLRVFDGLDNDLRFSKLVYDPAFRLGLFIAGADVNGDGIDEILTGVGNGGSSHVRILQGTDGTALPGFEAGFQAFGDGPNDRGVRIAAIDIDGDGADDIITGGGPGSGSFRIYNAKDLETAEADALAFGADFTGGIYVG